MATYVEEADRGGEDLLGDEGCAPSDTEGRGLGRRRRREVEPAVQRAVARRRVAGVLTAALRARDGAQAARRREGK